MHKLVFVSHDRWVYWTKECVHGTSVVMTTVGLHTGDIITHSLDYENGRNVTMVNVTSNDA